MPNMETGSLKGKTVRKASDQVISGGLVPIPATIMAHYRQVVLCVDVIKVNKMTNPRELITGLKIDYTKHIRAEFGEYVQVHEEHDKTMRTRTTGAIATKPTGDSQGGHSFYSLTTGRMLDRRQWTHLHMPADVIERIHVLAKASQVGMNFTNVRNEVYDDFGTDNSDYDSDEDSDYESDDESSDDDDDDYDDFIEGVNIDNPPDPPDPPETNVDEPQNNHDDDSNVGDDNDTEFIPENENDNEN
jgi:hypothetical protein